MLAISLGNLHYMGRSGPLVAALVDILCMQVQRIKEVSATPQTTAVTDTACEQPLHADTFARYCARCERSRAVFRVCTRAMTLLS